MHHFLERHFIVIIILFSVTALFEPSLFVPLKTFIPMLLSIIMFSMGFSLTIKSTDVIWNRKRIVLIPLTTKYLIMPIAAYIIGWIFHLSLLELIGIVLIGACPGGTAANVMSYLSKGNLFLTVLLTFGTTILAPLATPLLIYIFFHKHINIPVLSIFYTMLFILLVPIFTGILLKRKLHNHAEKINEALPVISIIAIGLVVACVIALNHSNIISFPTHIILAVTTLNITGYIIGTAIAKIMKCKSPEIKSISFEFGVFDSGLGVVIANSFFGPVAALPGALISIIQNLTAPLLVKIYLREKDTKLKKGTVNAS